MKLKKISIYLFFLLILPIIDSINGYINGGGNEGGLSLGIIYRTVILLICMIIYFNIGVHSTRIVTFFTVIYSITIAILNYRNGSMFFLLTKLLLPIVILETNCKLIKAKQLTYEKYIKIINIWLWMFPLTIVVPYFLKIGFNTYGSEAVGYKGFYYAQNDIGYILIICYLLVLLKVIEQFSLANSMCLIIALFCNLLLGLKSNYLMIFVVTSFAIFRRTKKNKFWKICTLVIVFLGGAFVWVFFQKEIQEIIERWKYFINLNGFVSLFFSTRNERIIPSFQYMINRAGWMSVIFGGGLCYTMINASLHIEMDIFDIYFQLGTIGVMLIYGYYFGIYSSCKSKLLRSKFKIAFLLSIIVSTLAGHVLETALSGMFFSMICTGLLFKNERVQNPYGR